MIVEAKSRVLAKKTKNKVLMGPQGGWTEWYPVQLIG
jgi:hypothetical protein